MTDWMNTKDYLTEEEWELLDWHSPKTGWWMKEKRDDLCRGCNGRPLEDCTTRAALRTISWLRALVEAKDIAIKGVLAGTATKERVERALALKEENDG